MKDKHHSRYNINWLLAFIVYMPFSVMATPLTMEYTVNDIGGGLFQYDFELMLDNNDNTWVSGMEWDWIIFGDVSFGNTSPLADFGNFVATDLPTGSTLITTSGGHNGPTLEIGGDVLLPGWNPTAIGESISWQGTSAAYLWQGELLWSSLVTGGGATSVQFEVANNVNSVPEPTILGLLSLGLVGLGAATKRRNRMH